MDYELRGWYISDSWGSWLARGSVYGHPKFKDGQRIHTSAIVSIVPGETSMVVMTKNSTYVCQYDECLDSTLDFLKDTRLIQEGNADDIRQCILTYVSARLSAEESKIFASIPANVDCMVLVLTNFKGLYLDRCIKRCDGDISLVECFPHLGMFQDSVSAVDHASGVDVRYMPMGGGFLKFYSWDAVHTPVYAYNTGDKLLNLEIGGKVHELFPGATPLRIESD